MDRKRQQQSKSEGDSERGKKKKQYRTGENEEEEEEKAARLVAHALVVSVRYVLYYNSIICNRIALLYQLLVKSFITKCESFEIV